VKFRRIKTQGLSKHSQLASGLNTLENKLRSEQITGAGLGSIKSHGWARATNQPGASTGESSELSLARSVGPSNQPTRGEHWRKLRAFARSLGGPEQPTNQGRALAKAQSFRSLAGGPEQPTNQGRAVKHETQGRKLAGRERRPFSQSFYSPRFGFVDVTINWN